MIITEKKGKFNTGARLLKTVDVLRLEWYEASKRIMRKQTAAGREIMIRFMGMPQQLTQDDILYEDDNLVVVVDIIPCASLIIEPKTLQEWVALAYEIGNRHLPLFTNQQQLMTPVDMPLFNFLEAQGYAVKLQELILVNPLKTTVSPHNIQLGASVLSNQ